MKEYGGMGFRSSYGLNLAFFGKRGWNLLTSSNTLANKILKAKYFPGGNFLNA